MAIIGQKRRGAGLGQKLPQQIAEVGNKIYSGFRDGMIYGGGLAKNSAKSYLEGREELKKLGINPTDNAYVNAGDKLAGVGLIGGTIVEGIGRSM